MSDTEKVFGNQIPIITDEEYNNKNSRVHKQREAGNDLARLQIMYHVAKNMTDKSGMIVLGVEAMMLNEPDKIKKYVEWDVASKALNEIMEMAQLSLKNAGASKTEQYRNNPRYTADGKEPNAVLVKTDGSAELVCLDGFVGGDELGKPINCDRVDIVLKDLPDWSLDEFGIGLAGYVDKNGISKGLEENVRIQEISGYDYIAGDCVLVEIDGKYNYLPLNPKDAVDICDYFNK